ncbi:hypothetical protein PQ469_24900 [Mucilaginibacter sp. KACC 22773]|uniref:hypothetical protein n=1 Tax=Mucilaginibacter sp. KACC 22773 TaxID=3025671 RepID=UPI002365AC40|nr:hypothetical protein [Mucilaginibacter sp. KACC 22773]WDF77128.1 hypothetical protein PQ469_24900 [Mucilaginibacter sp. KACC 22773]
MDRRQKIMRLIIDALTANDELSYTYTGAATLMDMNIISLDFVVKTNRTGGELNIWGMIDVPLVLKAQYDGRSFLQEHPAIQRQIEGHLKKIAENINRLL